MENSLFDELFGTPKPVFSNCIIAVSTDKKERLVTVLQRFLTLLLTGLVWPYVGG